MATFLMRRGVAENAGTLSANATFPSDFSVPVDIAGARLAFQTIVTGAPTALNVALQGSLDGTNWVQLAVSSVIGGDLQSAIIIQGVARVRFVLTGLTGGVTPTVQALVRVS